MSTPKAEARKNIDRQQDAVGLDVQNNQRINLTAKLGVAVRELAPVDWFPAGFAKQG